MLFQSPLHPVQLQSSSPAWSVIGARLISCCFAPLMRVRSKFAGMIQTLTEKLKRFAERHTYCSHLQDIYTTYAGTVYIKTIAEWQNDFDPSDMQEAIIVDKYI